MLGLEAADRDEDQGYDRQENDEDGQHINVDEGLGGAVVAAAGEGEEGIADGGNALHEREQIDAEPQALPFIVRQKSEAGAAEAGEDLVDRHVAGGDGVGRRVRCGQITDRLLHPAIARIVGGAHHVVQKIEYNGQYAAYKNQEPHLVFDWIVFHGRPP